MRKCRYCGRPGLRWVYTQSQGWRLHDGDLAHTCEQGLAAWRARQADKPALPEREARVLRKVPPHYAPDWVAAIFDGPSSVLKGPEMEFTDV